MGVFCFLKQKTSLENIPLTSVCWEIHVRQRQNHAIHIRRCIAGDGYHSSAAVLPVGGRHVHAIHDCSVRGKQRKASQPVPAVSHKHGPDRASALAEAVHAVQGNALIVARQENLHQSNNVVADGNALQNAHDADLRKVVLHKIHAALSQHANNKQLDETDSGLFERGAAQRCVGAVGSLQFKFLEGDGERDADLMGGDGKKRRVEMERREWRRRRRRRRRIRRMKKKNKEGKKRKKK